MAFTPQSPRMNLRGALVAAALALLSVSVTAIETSNYPYDITDHNLSSGDGDGWGLMGAGDFDGDGHRDVFAHLFENASDSLGQRGVWILEGSATGPTGESHLISTVDKGFFREFPDLDGDGSDDFLFSVDDLRWGNYTRAGVEFQQVYPLPASKVFPVDWNDDGIIDLLAYHSDGVLRWHENSGGPNPTFTDHFVFDDWEWIRDTPVSRLSMEVGDLDGDRDIDLVLSSPQAIYWYRNLGGNPPRFESHLIHESPDSRDYWYISVKILDVDQNGKQDLIFFSESWYHHDDEPNTLLWFENWRGDGSLWLEHQIDQQYDLTGMRLHDIDFDGHPDPVVQAESGGIVGYVRDTTDRYGWRRLYLGRMDRYIRWDYHDEPGFWIDDLDGDDIPDTLVCERWSHEVFPPECYDIYAHCPPGSGTTYSGSNTKWVEVHPTGFRVTAEMRPSGEWNGYHRDGQEGWLEITAFNDSNQTLANVLVTAETTLIGSRNSMPVPLPIRDDLFTLSGETLRLPSLAVSETAYVAFPYRIGNNIPCGTPIGVRGISYASGTSADDRLRINLGRCLDQDEQTWRGSMVVARPEVWSPYRYYGSAIINLDVPSHYLVSGYRVDLKIRPVDGITDLYDEHLIMPNGDTAVLNFREVDSEYSLRATGSFLHPTPADGFSELEFRARTWNDDHPTVHWRMTLYFQDYRCGEMSADELLLQILGFGDPHSRFDYNRDGRVDSADLVWALSRGY